MVGHGRGGGSWLVQSQHDELMIYNGCMKDGGQEGGWLAGRRWSLGVGEGGNTRKATPRRILLQPQDWEHLNTSWSRRGDWPHAVGLSEGLGASYSTGDVAVVLLRGHAHMRPSRSATADPSRGVRVGLLLPSGVMVIRRAIMPMSFGSATKTPWAKVHADKLSPWGGHVGPYHLLPCN